jgi:hypothetical protein
MTVVLHLRLVLILDIVFKVKIVFEVEMQNQINAFYVFNEKNYKNLKF